MAAYAVAGGEVADHHACPAAEATDLHRERIGLLA